MAQHDAQIQQAPAAAAQLTAQGVLGAVRPQEAGTAYRPARMPRMKPDRCDEVPMPKDGSFNLPGLPLAWATNSPTAFTGSEGCTPSTLGTSAIWATGTGSVNGLSESLGYSVELTAIGPTELRISVQPSAGVRTTSSVPVLPPAPRLFSTTKGWHCRSDSCWPRQRARRCGSPSRRG